MKYTAQKKVEFAISQCKDALFIINKNHLKKVEDLVSQCHHEKKLNETLQKQIETLKNDQKEQEIEQNLKKDQNIKKIVADTKKQVETKMKQEFQKQIRTKAHSMMSHIKKSYEQTIESQSKTIKNLTNLNKRLQAEIQQCRNLQQYEKQQSELHFEKLQKQFQSYQHEYDMITKDCTFELQQTTFQLSQVKYHEIESSCLISAIQQLIICVHLA